ncbi:MAG TPA: LLM class flavin-dependent oxidoreductase [Candidatus Bathyarchaeia archaeon]|nr:LLM class flavin-dependent oxidoreductase [Candidatus Bathyarchaeia archaeon]
MTRYGLYLMNFGESSDPRVLVDLAVEAERVSWDGFFLTDTVQYHEAGQEPVTDTFNALAAIALKTQRIRIGTAVAVLPRRQPWQVARETVTIDQLSNGRLILGVGLGDPPDVEYEKFGQTSDPRVRGEKLDESLEILQGLWSGREYSFQGTHYRIDKAHFIPTPVNGSRIPIWVGGSWPNKAPFRRAARWDGVIPVKEQKTVNLEPRDLQEITAYIKKYRINNFPFDTVIIGNGKSKQEIETRRREYERQGITWWLKYLPAYRNSVKEMHEQIQEGPPGSGKHHV